MKTPSSSSKNAAPIGPYTPGISFGRLLFTSGQVGLEPHTGKLVPGGIEAQTRQTLVNLKNLAEASGTTLDHTLKTTIYLKDISHFSLVNEIYASFFSAPYPARSTIQVQALPADADIEIEAILEIP